MKYHILVWQENDGWGAQLLEHDISAQGDSRADVLYNISLAIAGESLTRSRDRRFKPLSEVPSAPERFIQLYENHSQRMWENLGGFWKMEDGSRFEPPENEIRILDPAHSPPISFSST